MSIDYNAATGHATEILLTILGGLSVAVMISVGRMPPPAGPDPTPGATGLKADNLQVELRDASPDPASLPPAEKQNTNEGMILKQDCVQRELCSDKPVTCVNHIKLFVACVEAVDEFNERRDKQFYRSKSHCNALEDFKEVIREISSRGAVAINSRGSHAAGFAEALSEFHNKEPEERFGR